MKVKIGEIVNCYPVIMKSSLSKMNGKAKLQMLKIIKVLKPIAIGFEDSRKEAVERLADDAYKAAMEKVNKPNDYKEDEVKEALKVVKTSDEAYNKFMQEESEKEVDVEYELLDEENFEALLEGSKDLMPQELMMLSELIAK